MVTTPAWAATATLSAKKQSITADDIKFSLGGEYTINNILVDYSYTGSGDEVTLSWTVPTGYTISVSQISINAKNSKSWGTTGKGQYKTSKNSSYTQFCNSNSWTNYTLNNSSYFPLGNDGSITIKAIDKELQWKDIVFTYTKTANKYNIAFDANGGTGTTQSISNVSYDTDVKLTPNGFTRNKFTITYDANGGTCATAQEIRNYTFAGWAETSSGAVKYADNQSVRNLTSTNGATVTLYAKWNEPNNTTLTLPTATKTGAVLEGWYLGDTKIGEAGDTYTPTSSVTLTAKWIEKYTPEITGSNATMLVGNTLPNAFTFKNTFNPTAVITTKSISDIRNGNEVITYDAIENEIIAHNAGIAEIYFYQAPTTTIEEGYSATYTITVNKRTTDFEINFANEYFVDDEINKSTFFTNSTNSEVAIQVSDKTADNRVLFTYNGSILKANGATLNANSETTTITVTQPETYKWTGKTLTKEVLVKKYPTDFSWLLKDTYYVEDVITDIFTKTNNSLSSTITSSYPNIVKVEGNQLKALNAGEVTITVSQAVDRKWIAFTQTKEITVLKHDIVATINPNTAYWNELVSNPFSATSTHPVSGQVTSIPTFTVTQQNNQHIAKLNNANYSIQTYYTNGTVDFHITRPADDKYNALNQTLTLTVNASTENCDIFTDPTERNFSTGITDFSGKAGYAYEIPEDVRAYADSVYITAKRNGENYFYLQYSTNGGAQWTDFPEGLLDLSTSSYKTFGLKIPEGKIVTHIRPFAKTGATLRKDYKDFRVTRAKELTPSDSLVILPVTSIGTPETKTFTLKWSTCADEILLTNSNPHFTINTYNISSTAGQGSTAITVTCDASVVDTLRDTIVIYDQTQRIFVPVECIVNDKFIANIKGTTAYNKKVDDTWVADFKFDTCQTTLPSDDINAPFYYTIDHDLTGNNVLKTGYKNQVISYNPSEYTITAHNAGTAVLTFIQKPTTTHYTDTLRCVITVSKHDAELQWKDPVYYNDTISNYFTTSNTTSSIVIASQTDTDVAKLTNEFNPTSNNSLDLITFNKEASTTVTVSQVETYYWNGYSELHTITPIDQNNHVTFTLTQENYISAFKHSFVDPAANDQSKGPDWQSGGIYFGGEGAFDDNEGWNWNEKYYIIQFTGIPDSIYFDASRSDAATRTIKLSVSEGKTPDNLTEVWSNSNNSENNKIIRKLNPDSRYLKFSYTGNLWGLFKNITVTELNEFRAVDQNNDTQDVTHLDFGANQVFTSKTLPFKLRYANPGYKITVESTDPHFTVDPSYIGDIGGENHGTRTINVTYTSSEPYATSSNAMIIINDEISEEHSDTVYLSASSYKAEQVIHWRDDFEKIPQPIIRRKNGEITDAAWATSSLPVTYTSNNPDVIKISADGKTLIPVAEGEAKITAYQLGNETWLPADDTTKTFIVTEKLLQYIIWDDDLTNIIKEDITPQTLPLTAQVYLQQEDGTVVFSQEQTEQLIYQSGNDNIVSAVGSTLTINNVGNTTLTATVNGNDDYATASMTKTVIVRSATPGCDDNLLYHHEGDPIQFFQYNLDEIIKEPIALDRSKGEAGYVVVSHYGQSWNLAIQYYAAEIRVEQSLDNCSTWSTIETIRPVKNQENFDTIPLNRQATHIRFVRNANGQGYQFLYNIDVHPAQYIEAQDVVNFGEIHVGSRETRTFPLHYSNIKHSLSPVPSTSEVTATPNTFGECSGFGTQDISVTWLPTQVSDNATATITFTDPNSRMEKIVTLVAKVTTGTQNIIWDNRPTIIEDCGSILFPEKTTANLPITWTVIQGNEYADFNEQGMLEIYKNGTIVVEATQEGTANYEPLTPVQYTFDIQIQTIFVGTEDSDWHNPNNWTMCRLPYPTEVVTMEHPATLSTHATVAGVIFSTNGSIHITHTGGLTINEAGVTNAATDGSSIIIDNNPQGAGFLLISPSAPEANKYPYFTMNFTTRAFNEGVPRDETWQYMGAPGNNATFKNLDSQTLIYHWDETKGWKPYTVNGSLPTWQGYALTQSIQPNQTYQITAQAIQGTKTIDLTYTSLGMKGDNLFVNSFTAPIDIAKFTTGDITGNWGYQTFYFFNTGSWNDWQGTNPNHTHDASSAGHYYAVPLFSAPYLEGSQTIVPPMQGVYVHTEEAPVSITLNYEKHVWNGSAGNLPMRAPQKQSPDFQRVRIQVSSENSGADRMYIIQEPSTTRDYDNGYDGKNINAQGQVNIYTNEPFGKMEVSCANNIDSMYIGLRTGNDTHYTLTFGAIAGDSLYLQDLENDSIIPLFNDEQYHFTAQPNTVNNSRFLLLSHPRFAPNTSTPTTDINGDTLAKIWSIGSTIYIANAPANSWATLYTVSGHLVLSTPIANTQSPATLDVSHLPQGVYILRLNNQVYKFVCK